MARTPFRRLGQSLTVSNNQGITGQSDANIIVEGGDADPGVDPDGNGGSVSISGGTAAGNGDGGGISLQGGASGGGAGAGSGGDVSIAAGNAVGSNAAGGDLTLTAGNSNSVNNGGIIQIQSGTSASGSGGNIQFIIPSGGVYSLRTHNNGLNIARETLTYAAQVSHIANGTHTVTLGSCPANNNLKVDMYVTGRADDGSGTIAWRYIQTWTKGAVGSPGSLTAHLNSFVTSGANPFFSVQVVGNTNSVNFVVTSESSGGPWLWNWAIHWTRQRGGFAP